MSASLLICGFGAFPQAPRNPAQAAIEALSEVGWSPDGALVRYLVLPVAWRGSAEAVLAQLAAESVDAVLVVGVAVSAQSFHVERLGRNRAALQKADDLGDVWSIETVSTAGADELRVTAPVRSMVTAIERLGLPAELSDDAGDYLCNFTLYRLLEAQAAPAVGFLHVPQALECAEGARFTLADIGAAVQAAAEAMTQALSRPDASRRTA
ncbi:MAG TPA: hypothetical protein VIO94_06480 [Phenylobacterium sp.]